MNKTSTYIGIIGILLVLASVVYTYKYAPIKPMDNGLGGSGGQDGLIDNGTNGGAISSSTEQILGETKLYTDSSELFTFLYPANLQGLQVLKGAATNTNDWRVSPRDGELGKVRVNLIIPDSFDPNTNFRDAKMTIAFGANQKATDNCLSNSANGSGENVQTSTVSINGIPFKKTVFSDAGAGNYYETTSFKAVRAGQCISIEYTIHSTNRQSYPEEMNIGEFNKAKIVRVLDAIVQTIKFSSTYTSAGAGTTNNGSNTGADSGSDAGATRTSPDSLKYGDSPGPVTLDGTFICLPHKNTSGPQTMECAYGLKSKTTGFNYALDLGTAGPGVEAVISGGGTIRVTGYYVPAMALSSDHWQKYNMEGVIQVSNATRI